MPLVATCDDIAFGQERKAYADAVAGCRYWHQDGELVSCRVRRGTTMATTMPKTRTPHVVRCTDILDNQWWLKARTSYDTLQQVLLARSQHGNLGAYNSLNEIVTAARNAGYFYLCDYLRNGRQDAPNVVRLVRDAWTLVDQTTREKMPGRNSEINAKLPILDVIAVKGAGVPTCSDPCPEWVD